MLNFFTFSWEELSRALHWKQGMWYVISRVQGQEMETQEVRWSTEAGSLWDRTEAHLFWPKSRPLFRTGHRSAQFPRRKKAHLLEFTLLPTDTVVRVLLRKKLEALWNIFPVKLYAMCVIVIKLFFFLDAYDVSSQWILIFDNSLGNTFLTYTVLES